MLKDNEIKDITLTIMKKIFNEKLPKQIEKINKNSLKKWDSINHLHLILAIEKQFNIKFKNSEVFDLISFELIMNNLKNKING